MIDRRGFLGVLTGAIAAPMICRSGILMPVKQVLLPTRTPLIEVFDGASWKALAYHNVSRGRLPDYMGQQKSLLDYAKASFPLVRVVFDQSWTPKTVQSHDWKVGSIASEWRADGVRGGHETTFFHEGPPVEFTRLQRQQSIAEFRGARPYIKRGLIDV